jgi:hypothetical protein
VATPLKRWFRVADSVAREPWDNDTLAAVVRLMAHMNTRRSRDQLRGDATAKVSPMS